MNEDIKARNYRDRNNIHSSWYRSVFSLKILLGLPKGYKEPFKVEPRFEKTPVVEQYFWPKAIVLQPYTYNRVPEEIFAETGAAAKAKQMRPYSKDKEIGQ